MQVTCVLRVLRFPRAARTGAAVDEGLPVELAVEALPDQVGAALVALRIVCNDIAVNRRTPPVEVPWCKTRPPLWLTRALAAAAHRQLLTLPRGDAASADAAADPVNWACRHRPAIGKVPWNRSCMSVRSLSCAQGVVSMRAKPR